MLLEYASKQVKLRDVLHTSYGLVLGADNGFVKLSHDGLEGYGEAVPIGRYDETIKGVLESFEEYKSGLSSINDIWAIEKVDEICRNAKIHSNAARSAIMMALYDLIGKEAGVPLYKIFGGTGLNTPEVSYTIGVDNAENVVRKVQEAKDCPIIKLKIGSKNDIEAIKEIRKVTDTTIRVDANAGWTREQAVEMINTLSEYNIQFVEQPVAWNDYEGLKYVKDRVSVPIIADESCRGIDSIKNLINCVDGINIKLAKCGGLGQAYKMIHMAKALGMKVMIGCFLESSLAVTAAAHLTPLVDYADLDPILFTENDPFVGLKIENGRLILPNKPGIGAVPVEKYEEE